MKNQPAERSFIKGESVAWENAGSGVQRQVLGYDDNLMMVRVRFEKNAVGTIHTHPHRQVTSIESGSFEVKIGGQEMILMQGDSFFVRPEVPHGVVALEAGCLVDVFTPARLDFVNSEQLW
jgi:quercetin dioxygenase-like cupin family protein